MTNETTRRVNRANTTAHTTIPRSGTHWSRTLVACVAGLVASNVYASTKTVTPCVKKSFAAGPCSREPKDDAFIPPNGAQKSTPVVGALTRTMPTSLCRMNCSTAATFAVNSPAESP